MIPKYQKPELEQDFTAENIKDFLKWMKIFSKKDLIQISELTTHERLSRVIPKSYPIRKIIKTYDEVHGIILPLGGWSVFDLTLSLGTSWVDFEFYQSGVQLREGIENENDPQVVEQMLESQSIPFSKSEDYFFLRDWKTGFEFIRALRNNLYQGVPPCE